MANDLIDASSVPGELTLALSGIDGNQLVVATSICFGDQRTALRFMLVCDFAGRKASGSSAAGCGAPAENRTILLVYLISGAGNLSENARSNDARSALGKSETAT